MSKLDKNGEPIYNENGKVLKGPNYFKPDLKIFYERQLLLDIVRYSYWNIDLYS